MKKTILYTILITLLIISSYTRLNAQPYPNETSGGGNVSGVRIGAGGGAPIGSGNLILIMLAVVYAGRKAYRVKSDFGDGTD